MNAGNADKTQVLFDANALMAPGQFGVDVFSKIEELIGSYEPIVIKGVLRELDGLKKERGSCGMGAKVGVKLAARCTVYDNPREDLAVDDMIVEFADNAGCMVVTNDRGLKEKLLDRGVDVIVLRNLKTLDIIRGRY